MWLVRCKEHAVSRSPWVRNQGNRTTHNTPGHVTNITRCLQKMEATSEDAFTTSLKYTRRISPSKEKIESSNTTWERSREGQKMITRKDLGEEWSDKAASVHLLRAKRLRQWQRKQLRSIHMREIWTCADLFKAGRLACDVCPACRNHRPRITRGDNRSISLQ